VAPPPAEEPGRGATNASITAGSGTTTPVSSSDDESEEDDDDVTPPSAMRPLRSVVTPLTPVTPVCALSDRVAVSSVANGDTVVSGTAFTSVDTPCRALRLLGLPPEPATRPPSP
jgi:hypothetical protein